MVEDSTEQRSEHLPYDPIAKVEDSTEQRSEHLPVNRRWQNLVLRQYCMYIERWCTDLVRIEALTRIMKHNGPDCALSSRPKKRGPKSSYPAESSKWRIENSEPRMIEIWACEAITRTHTLQHLNSPPKKTLTILGRRLDRTTSLWAPT